MNTDPIDMQLQIAKRLLSWAYLHLTLDLQHTLGEQDKLKLHNEFMAFRSEVGASYMEKQ